MKLNKILMSLICAIMLIGLVSAADFDNVISEIPRTTQSNVTIGTEQIKYNPIWEKYPPIQIKNSFGLGSTLFEGAITEHTDSCSTDCESIIKIDLKTNSALIDSLKFYTIDGVKRTEQPIKSFKLNVKTGEKINKIDDYENSCSTITEINGTKTTNCIKIKVGSHDVIENIYSPYVIGGILSAGNYTIQITGDKKSNRNVDWIITTQGKELTSWAVWANTSLTNNLNAYWKFDEGTGTLAEDKIGGISNGTLTKIGWNATGKFNSGLQSYGADANKTNASSNFRLQMVDAGWSASVWVYANDISTNAIISKRAEAAGIEDGYSIQFNDPTTLRVHFYENKDFTISSFPTGRWVHIAATYNVANGNLSLYINGTNVGNQSVTINTDTDASPLSIGGYNNAGGASWNGSIDEVGIWNRTLGSTEILSLYNAGLGLAYPLTLNSVTLNSPIDNYHTSIRYNEFNCSATPTSPATLTNISLIDNSTGVWKINKTISLSGATNTTIFNNTLPYNSFLWSCYACDSDGDCAYANNNRTIFIDKLVVNNQTYNATTYDTSSENFQVNVTYVSDSFISASANLIYNGTSYTASGTAYGNNVIFSRTIDIPIVKSQQTKGFYWNIYLTNLSGGTEIFNTSTSSQVVSPSYFAQCNATYPVLGINYTTYDEDSFVNITSTFKSTVYWYLGSGTIKKNASFDLGLNDFFKFCISPNKTFYIAPTIKLSSAGHMDRTFSFANIPINNLTTEKKLYLLNSSLGTNVIIEFRETTLVPIAGAYLKIYRYYPDLNNYVSIHEDKTDNFGVVVGSLIQNNVKYKFKYYNVSDSLLKETASDVTIACRSTICVLTFLRDTASTDFDRFKNLTDYTYSLTFNNDSNTFIYVWNDNTGSSPHHRLQVERILGNGTTIVCNVTSTELAGSLSCSVGSTIASYNAQAFRYASPERRIGLLQIKVGDISGIFGVEGLIWSFILFMTLISVGSWNPPIGVVLYLAGFLIIGLTGIVYVNPAIIVAMLAAGICFCWAFRS